MTHNKKSPDRGYDKNWNQKYLPHNNGNQEITRAGVASQQKVALQLSTPKSVDLRKKNKEVDELAFRKDACAHLAGFFSHAAGDGCNPLE
uniref:Uncharacterized protein n=1 Tax=Ditylenchus dipsaci TaxID=166011 RepID=A0A915EHB0_9BILA